MAKAQPARDLPSAAGRDLRLEKRGLILEAAIRVFARTGYHRARVSDIAREAGIAYGLVYHYFKNKDEILGTIFEERWSAFLGVVEAIGETPAPTREKLEKLAGLILGTYRVRPDWVKVLVLEIQRSSRFAEPGQIRAVGRLLQLVSRILRAGQDAGELRRELDAEIAATMFIGALEWVITALVLDVKRLEGNETEDAYVERVARTVVDVFFNGVHEGDSE